MANPQDNFLFRVSSGTLVAVKNTGRNGCGQLSFTIYKVVRTTATQAVCVPDRESSSRGYAEMRFQLSTGRLIGGDHFSRVLEATPEILEQHKQEVTAEQLRRRFSALCDKTLSTEQIAAMLAAYDAVSAAQKAG